MWLLKSQKILGKTITIFLIKLYCKIFLSEFFKPILQKFLEFRFSRQFDHIEKRLKKSGYNNIQTYYLLDRFYSIKKNEQIREMEKEQQHMYRQFAIWCEITGTKQWEGREILEREFNIKL